MTSVDVPDPLTLSDPAMKVTWRIFGTGESPLNGSSSYDLIRPMVEDEVPKANQHKVVRELQSCFELHGGRHWLRPELEGPVAEAILDGITPGNTADSAVWAIGSIDPDLAAERLKSNWTARDVDGFVHAAIRNLGSACDRDSVLDLSRRPGLGLDSAHTKIPADAFNRASRIETFQELENRGIRFVLGGLHQSVDNLIELLVALRPDCFSNLVGSLEHPVAQARVARCAVRRIRPINHRATLDWIHADACPEQIALAIVHSLETVNALDRDLQSATLDGKDTRALSTELRPGIDDLGASAEGLLAGLAERVFEQRRLDRAQWIGEILGAGQRSIDARYYEEPVRFRQLEAACNQILERIFSHSSTQEQLEALCTGLRSDRHASWVRHLGAIAWSLRESDPQRASRIARVALLNHETHVDHVLESNLPLMDWRDWKHRAWIRSLSQSLILGESALELHAWVMSKCQKLPLSAWDADAQDGRTFLTADRVARHWFLIAFHAVSHLEGTDRAVEPDVVLSLTDTFWNHLHFSRPFVLERPASSVEEEFAVRCAVEFGHPNDQWFLDLARHPASVGRDLWAAIDQQSLKREGARTIESSTNLVEPFRTDFASVASDRFRAGNRWESEALAYWGLLWVALNWVDEAQRTAFSLLAFPSERLSRTQLVISLKLLALSSWESESGYDVHDRIRSLYDDLWSVFTPEEEKLDRQHVDALLDCKNL